MPAFSAKGLYFAITATISTYLVPTSGNVSRISLAPNPIVRYLGWTTTLKIMLTFSFISFTAILGKT
jgi:hypothetical protein